MLVGATFKAAVVAPELHKYVVPPEAVRETEAPIQMIPSSFVTPLVSTTAITGTGKGLAVIFTDVDDVQPKDVTVTV